MSVGVLYDPNESKACLYDSVSDTAFGPLFDDGEGTSARDEAVDFLAWVRDSGRQDTRMMTEAKLSRAIYEWQQEREEPSRVTSDRLSAVDTDVDFGGSYRGYA